MIASHKLGSRWTLLVLRELINGPKRFSGLQKTLPWIPAKSLARVLSRLGKEGMVQRKVVSTRPPKVIYSITRNDRLLRNVIDALWRWGKENEHRRKAFR